MEEGRGVLGRGGSPCQGACRAASREGGGLTATGADLGGHARRGEGRGEASQALTCYYENMRFCVVFILFNEHLMFFFFLFQDKKIKKKGWCSNAHCSIFFFFHVDTL